MATDDKSKTKPMRTKKKSDGWREREESRAAGITPRTTSKNDSEHEHALVQA
jgi:hypothetical protein